MSLTSEGEEVGKVAISGGMMGCLACGLSEPMNRLQMQGRMFVLWPHVPHSSKKEPD